jgi:putative membrane protein
MRRLRMFVDYLTLMLLNMVVALVLFAWFMTLGFEKNQKRFVPGFLLTGFIGLVTGLHMIFRWPLPGSFNIMFGEPTVMLGGFFFVAGLALLLGWDLLTIGLYALFCGAAVVLLGVRILNMNLTQEPIIAAIGYFLTGATAIATFPALALPSWKWLRWLVALAAIGSAVIWIIVGYPSYWAHMAAFGKWAPPTMPPAPPK